MMMIMSLFKTCFRLFWCQNRLRWMWLRREERLCKHVRQNIFRNKVTKGKNAFVSMLGKISSVTKSRREKRLFWCQSRLRWMWFQLKTVDFSIPGRSRTGPALKIDAFLKAFNWNPLKFRSPAAPDPARRSKSKKIKENQRKTKKIKENPRKSKKIKENRRKSKKIKEK